MNSLELLGLANRLCPHESLSAALSRAGMVAGLERLQGFSPGS